MTPPCSETSFLCALYRKQEQTPQAIDLLESMTDPLPVSVLVLFEFRQSVRLQQRWHRNNPKLGFGAREGQAMLRDLQSDFSAGVLAVLPTDWAGVFSLAEMLSAKHTENRGDDVVGIGMVDLHPDYGTKSGLQPRCLLAWRIPRNSVVAKASRPT